MAGEREPGLVGPRALAGVRVGVSVSDSPDLARLGLDESHVRIALGELARAVLVAGGELAYGGRLDPAGYTAFLQGELERYAQRHDQPLVVYLAWQEHRALSLAELDAADTNLGMHGRIVCLDAKGAPIDASEERGDAPEPVEDPAIRAHALTCLRRRLAQETGARVALGGRRSGFQGAMAGIVEELLIAIEAGQPVFLAAGFGGATWDAARALGLLSAEWPDLAGPAAEIDARHADGLAELLEAARGAGWHATSNGLDEQENRRLVASHRASEVASLVALGLGRLHAAGPPESLPIT